MDFAQFAANHSPALEKDEARHNLILGLMARIAAQNDAGEAQSWSFGRPGACAIRTEPTYGLLLGEVSEADCRALAESLAGTHFLSVQGPDRTAHWFAEHAKGLGEQFKEPVAQRIHALSGALCWPKAKGTLRPVTSEDADLFASMAFAFAAEATPENPPPSRSALDARAGSGEFWFWTVDDEPAAMAGIVRRTRHTATISWVYTLPAQRGQGYAGSVTAAVVEKIYAEGRRTACLYTDLSNPWSNRCYEKIGFRPVCDSWLFMQAKRGA